MKFWAIDTETTHMDPEAGRIIELYAAEVTFPDIKVQSWLSYRFNPGMPIPAEATKLHGIRDEDVNHELPFSFRAAWWQSQFEGACIIAYNAQFDLKILDAELRRAGQKGLSVNTPVLDPYDYFREDLGRTLTDAVRYYLHKPHPDAHSARGDVRAMLKVLRRQLKTRDPELLLQTALNPNRVDFAGKFTRDLAGQITFNFGKHRGQPAASQPQYLAWILGSDFPADAKDVARRVLNDCSNPEHEKRASERPMRSWRRTS